MQSDWKLEKVFDMKKWESLLKEDATDWLLEESNPSVRYFALTEILDTSEDDSKVKKAKDDIMRIATVPDILARQKARALQVRRTRSHPVGTITPLRQQSVKCSLLQT